LILAVVVPLSGGDPLRAIALASMMAVVSGGVCIAAGLVRLGFVTELLSKPIRYGYMNGIALTVLIGQLPKMFGFSVEESGPLRKLFDIAQAVLQGKANWTAFALSGGTLAVILLLKGRKRVPGILIAVVSATVVVSGLEPAKRAGVPVIGSLPQGLPAFATPWITYGDIMPVFIGGCAVALVAFADTSVVNTTSARHTQQAAQSFPISRLHRHLTQELMASLELPKELIVQIVPIHEDHQRRIFHRWFANDASGIEQHEEALARTLHLPHIRVQAL
jgi:MFS superfamily sulfate permease-like transporter